MTQAPSQQRHISPGELAAFSARVFVSRGMTQAHAAQVADVLVWADLRGVDSHGVERLPSYLAIMDRGGMNPKGAPRLDDVAPAMFRIDADRAAGPVPMMMAVEEAMSRARTFGVSMGLVCRSAHTGAVGYYVQKAAREGFVAMVLGSGPPLMAYYGARAPSLSTSPLAIGVPGGPDGAIVLDMATSVASNGKLKQAQREKKPIPEGWALDADGNSTTDPAKAAISLPIGGPKGAGLGLMFECVTSVLAGAPLLANMLGPGNKPFHMQSEMFIAIDAAKFRARDDFETDIEALAGVIKGLPRVDEAQPIRLPGERAEDEARRRAVSGVPISPRLQTQLSELAGQCGVAPPTYTS
ncbi:MAG: Ldh family oxidoreductase [Beijerinckiaceae bacterium]|nr:Ldh family oxidoreductase [Beijerinckiaceae bacterium]